MHEPRNVTIGSLFLDVFPGVWGSDPTPRFPASARVLRATDIDSEGHVNVATAAHRRLTGRELSNKRLKPGDIIIEVSGGAPGKPVGRTAIIGDFEDTVCSNFFRTLRPKSDVVEPRYLAWYLQLFYRKPEIWKYQQQTTGIFNLRLQEYLQCQVPLPAISEQERIADVLDAAEEQIDITARTLIKLKAIKGAVWSELYMCIKAPRSELGQLLQEYPRNGYSPVEATGYTGIFSLGLGCLTQDGFAPVQLKPVNARDPAVTRFLLSDGDLLMSRSNTRDLVGMAGRYHDIGSPCIYPDLMMRLRPRGEIRPDFLELTLRSPSVRRQIQAAAQGTSGSMVKIGASAVRNLMIPLPDHEEQARVVHAVQPWADAQDNLQRTLRKQQMVKRGLMDDLLTGAVRIDSCHESS
jgi:type I restriction enzyme, S subunit